MLSGTDDGPNPAWYDIWSPWGVLDRSVFDLSVSVWRMNFLELHKGLMELRYLDLPSK